MPIYDGMIIFPNDTNLSDSAWSELIQQILLRGEDNFTLHSLKQIVGSPKVPEHLKTTDLKNRIAWLKFENEHPGLFIFRGSSVGGCFELNDHRMTEISEWLLKSEQVTIRLRAMKRLLEILQDVRPSDSSRRWINWLRTQEVSAIP